MNGLSLANKITELTGSVYTDQILFIRIESEFSESPRSACTVVGCINTTLPWGSHIIKAY